MLLLGIVDRNTAQGLSVAKHNVLIAVQLVQLYHTLLSERQRADRAKDGTPAVLEPLLSLYARHKHDSRFSVSAGTYAYNP